ncbi:hypothetical protein B0H34DRAFT_17873 [Crassisporium funariophilum]|nr:hypothetical protein B0H34DRAFT_17873 [Crassisporium funariophilum]
MSGVQTGTSGLNTYLHNQGRLASLSWQESWAGPSNARKWTVICKSMFLFIIINNAIARIFVFEVDGQARGEGTATLKHIAKNLAADAALDALKAKNAS